MEKEGLGVVWACERFQDFITGLHVLIETDHKPLVPIFSSKNLADITPRLQRMKLRMMRFSYDMRHIPGKALITADLLSRKPLQETGQGDFQEQIALYVSGLTACLPATDHRLKEIREKQVADVTCRTLIKYSEEGWPTRNAVQTDCRDYWPHRSEIALQDGLLMRGSRIIIPQSMRHDILQRLHEGHQGITKCRARARQSVWWPGLSRQVEDVVRTCTQCIQETHNRHEPLLPSKFPDRPWQKVAMDLFYLEGKDYLLVTDYFSRFPEIALLNSLTATTIITHLKSFFARHGTPEVVFSDNGPQFRKIQGSEFQKFAESWGFEHRTSSPRYPQSNGFVEVAVGIIKRSLKKTGDSYVALQAYRSTPLGNGYSPAELLMGRRLRTSLPTADSLLQPRHVDKESLDLWEERRIMNQKRNYDRRHGARRLQSLKPGDRVWITDRRETGIVQSSADAPRSYSVNTQDGNFSRNRFHLVPMPTVSKSPDLPPQDTTAERTFEPTYGTPHSDHVVTRSGRVVKPVVRFSP